MKRSFGNHAPPLSGARPIVTLGMFDGVHLGHRAVFREVRSWAQALGAPTLVLTFDQHPRLRTAPASAPEMITSLEHRLLLMEQMGLDAAWVLSFTEDLAALPALDFARRYFHETLHAQGIVLGTKARFGKGASGGIPLLRSLANAHDCPVREVGGIDVEGEPVSSTAIRQAVRDGDLARAEAMLGRAPSVLGTVVEGIGVGRTLGFPTLNLDPHHELFPPLGVYACRARCGDTVWDAVTNIGLRPTVREEKAPLIETHLLDFSGELYGQVVEVSFLEKLRDEKRFPDHDALRHQILLDVENARACLARLPTAP